MPDTYTHYYFAKDLKERMELIDIDESYYFLGAQGPDFLFYLNFLSPKRNISPKHKLGHLMHRKFTVQLLDYVFDKIEHSDKVLRSYLMGFIAHYSLDSTAHPLIFREAGSGRTHKKLEVNIDVRMHLERTGERLRGRKISDVIYVGENLDESVIDFYIDVLRDVFSTEVEREIINTAYGDFVKFLKITRAKGLLRLGLIKTLILLSPAEIDQYLIPKEPELEYLPEKTYREFLILYDEALLKGIRLLSEGLSERLLVNFDGD